MMFSSTELCLAVPMTLFLIHVNSQCLDVKEPKDGSLLAFKEPSYSNHVTYELGESTFLNCRTYNFCNIQWYRGSNLIDPYPWNTSTSLVWYELTDSNQFLKFGDNCGETKNYTCVASNGTDEIQRTITVNPRGHPPDSSYRLQTDSCHNQTACIGDHVFFNCTYQLVSSNVPPFLTTSWYYQSWDDDEPITHVAWKSGQSGITYKVTKDHYKRNSSELYNDEDVCSSPVQSPIVSRSTTIIVSQLDFKVVNQEAYGIYTLQFISVEPVTLSLQLTPGPECKPVTNVRAISGSIICFVCLLLVIIIVVKALSLNVRVWYKDAFGKPEIDDGKRYDVYISYNSASQEDRIFATQTLREHLMNKLGYTVCVYDINIIPGTDVIEEITYALDMSRRFILIISPDYLASTVASTELDIAMDRFAHSTSHIIPVLFQKVTKEQVAESKMLGHIITSCIHWRSIRFFKELQLRMPPRRGLHDGKDDGLVLNEVFPDGFARHFEEEHMDNIDVALPAPAGP